jgi:hypothetical protein
MNHTATSFIILKLHVSGMRVKCWEPRAHTFTSALSNTHQFTHTLLISNVSPPPALQPPFPAPVLSKIRLRS